jgi:hypothetical protein
MTVEEYFDAWLKIMRDKGHNRAFIYIDEVYSLHHLMKPSWSYDGASIDDMAPESHAAWEDGINAFIELEPQCPPQLLQTPFVEQILAGAHQWPQVKEWNN